MSDLPQDPPQPPPKRGKRWLVLALAGVVLIAGALWFASHGESDDEAASLSSPAPIVYRLKHTPPPPKLDIEYHFDRNAILDSRMLDGRIVGLAASGNLLVFDADTFALRHEKILRRRATCLGPGDGKHLLAGLYSGAIVRVGAADLALAHVTDVPGTPVWIGKRSPSGALVIAYQPQAWPGESVLVRDEGQGRTYDVGVEPVLFLDSKDQLWIARSNKVERLDLASGARETVLIKGGWAGVRGFAELLSGQVWTFGGSDRRGEMESFVAQVAPGPQAAWLYSAATRQRASKEPRPTTPISHVLEARDPPRLFVVSREGVAVGDATLDTWAPLDVMNAGRRDADTLVARGQAHVAGPRVVLALERGGFMEVTPDFTRRHWLENQNTVFRPSEIARLSDGMSFYGGGGPLYYSGGSWHPLPDAITPPAELMGPSRPGEKDRQWASIKNIPIEGGTSYILAKAGAPRHYVGHMHGLRDVFLTAIWNGKVLSVLGREDLPIEPDDTFATPDKQLWNIDEQGLWSLSGGHWRPVVQISAGNTSTATRPWANAPASEAAPSGLRSIIGERLHFRASRSTPFYGLPSGAPSWAVVRLDSNEAGGVPLIDEIPVKIGGRRLLLRDLTDYGKANEQFLLATDHGLCVFNIKYGTGELLRPEGLAGEVSVFMRDGTKRLWLGGRGLWVLRDSKLVDVVHPSIPMLADTRVVALAEATDGRIVVGTEDRGSIFLTIPPGWFQKPHDPPPAPEKWEEARPHEASFLDPGVVLRGCRGKAGQNLDAAFDELVALLHELAPSLGPRVRVMAERVFESKPDIVVRGAEPDKLVQEIAPLLEKLENKAKFSMQKRFGPLGSATVELKACPAF